MDVESVAVIVNQIYIFKMTKNVKVNHNYESVGLSQLAEGRTQTH